MRTVSCLLQQKKAVLGSHLFQFLPQLLEVRLSLLEIQDQKIAEETGN